MREERERLRREISQERGHKSAAEDRATLEVDRANRAEDEIRILRDQLMDANRAKDNYYGRACQLDEVKVEMDRLRHVEAENGNLRDQVRELEHKAATLNDRINDLDRTNSGL